MRGWGLLRLRVIWPSSGESLSCQNGGFAGQSYGYLATVPSQLGCGWGKKFGWLTARPDAALVDGKLWLKPGASDWSRYLCYWRRKPPTVLTSWWKTWAGQHGHKFGRYPARVRTFSRICTSCWSGSIHFLFWTTEKHWFSRMANQSNELSTLLTLKWKRRDTAGWPVWKGPCLVNGVNIATFLECRTNLIIYSHSLLKRKGLWKESINLVNQPI